MPYIIKNEVSKSPQHTDECQETCKIYWKWKTRTELPTLMQFAWFSGISPHNHTFTHFFFLNVMNFALHPSDPSVNHALLFHLTSRYIKNTMNNCNNVFVTLGALKSLPCFPLDIDANDILNYRK